MFSIFKRKGQLPEPAPAPAPAPAPSEFEIWSDKVKKIKVGLNTLESWASRPEEIEEAEDLLDEYSWVWQTTDHVDLQLMEQLQNITVDKNQQFWIRKVFKRFING